MYLVRDMECVEDAPGIESATLWLDDILPLVGFHGRSNPAGGLESLGFIWADVENEDCIKPATIDSAEPNLTYEKAEGLITNDDRAHSEKVESWAVEEGWVREEDDQS